MVNQMTENPIRPGDEAMLARQRVTPLADALDAQRINRLAHFDVPGHKGGRMNHELPDYFGKLCMSLDVNSMKSLDNLGHPVSVINPQKSEVAICLLSRWSSPSSRMNR